MYLLKGSQKLNVASLILHIIKLIKPNHTMDSSVNIKNIWRSGLDGKDAFRCVWCLDMLNTKIPYCSFIELITDQRKALDLIHTYITSVYPYIFQYYTAVRALFQVHPEFLDAHVGSYTDWCTAYDYYLDVASDMRSVRSEDSRFHPKICGKNLSKMQRLCITLNEDEAKVKERSYIDKCINNKCCVLCETKTEKHSDGYCEKCHKFTFPTIKEVNVRAREKAVIAYVRMNFRDVGLKFQFNRQVCKGVPWRPDIVIELSDRIIIIEVDEGQHLQYDFNKDGLRTKQLIEACGQKHVYVVRFNPDEYLDGDARHQEGCWCYMEDGQRVLKSAKMWAIRLMMLKRTLDTILRATPHKSTPECHTYHLFFDGYPKSINMVRYKESVFSIQEVKEHIQLRKMMGWGGDDDDNNDVVDSLVARASHLESTVKHLQAELKLRDQLVDVLTSHINNLHASINNLHADFNNLLANNNNLLSIITALRSGGEAVKK
jgi:very-short-patch-repair endonuclease